MGKIIIRQMRGMSWKTKISLVLIFTMVASLFMHEGWYSPRSLHAAVPTFVAAGTVTSNAAAITPAMPSGVQANDILLLFLETANQAITVSGGTETWSQVTNSPQSTGTAAGADGTRLTVFWARASQASPTSPTTSDSGDHQLGRIIAVRGCITTGNPWDITAGSVEATSDTTVSFPTVTTTMDDTLVVLAMAGSLPDATGTANFSAWTNSNLSSITERTDNTVTAGNGAALGVATGVKTTAGATGASTATLAQSANKAMMTIALRPPATTTLATGTDPGAATIAPGASATDVDAFTLKTNTGTETLTSVTVNLSTNNGVGTLAITDNSNNVLGSTTTPTTGSNAITVTGMTATTTATTFKVRVTPKAHADMPAVPGASYTITAPVTAWAGNIATHDGSDTNPNALTIDNASPNNATSYSGTAGNANNTLNWTASNSSDISQSVVLRWAASSAGSEVPAEGGSYTAGDSITGATVACVLASTASQVHSNIVDGTGGTSGCNTSALTNGQAYTYKIFSKDSNGNYSQTGVTVGPLTPVAPDSTPPTVTAFTVTTPTGSLNIPITSFTASDNIGVTGYKITTSDTSPGAGDAGWTGTAPTTYTVGSAGTYTLYPWAKDAANNVSNVFGTPRTVVVDQTAPTYDTWNSPASGSWHKDGDIITIDVAVSDSGGAGMTNGANCNPKIDGDASLLWSDGLCTADADPYPCCTGSGTGTCGNNVVYYTGAPYAGRCYGTATVANPSGLSLGSHNLTLQVADSVGNSTQSAARDIKIDNAAPTGLSYSSPADEASDQPKATTMNVTTATDGSGSGNVQYYFQLSNNPSFIDAGSCTGSKSPDDCCTGSGTGSCTLATGGWQSGTSYSPTLQYGATYYWHVKARDAVGNENLNLWSVPRSFSIIAACTPGDAVFALTTNPSGSGNINTTITTDGGAQQYYLLVRNTDNGDCPSTTFNMSIHEYDAANVFDPTVFASNDLDTRTVTLAPGKSTDSSELCTAAGVPYACCTAVRTGTCGSVACTSAGTPYSCCTGAGTGCSPVIVNVKATAGISYGRSTAHVDYSASCTGNGTPWSCCTAAGVGEYCVSGTIATNLNVAQCVHNKPELVIGPNTSNAPIPGPVNPSYTVSIKNKDAGSRCGSGPDREGPVTYTVDIISETNAGDTSTDFADSQLSPHVVGNTKQQTVTLEPGQIGTINLIATSKSTATRGHTNTTYLKASVTAGPNDPVHPDSDTVTATTTAGNALLHNSANVNSAKWAGFNGWGVPGGKYGEFVCTTCHIAGDSSNIKRIRNQIKTPDTTWGTLPGHAGGSTIIYDRNTGTSLQGSLGFDAWDTVNGTAATPRTSSSKICEYCHTYDATGANGVAAHPYAVVGTALPNHNDSDGLDCILCHKHSTGFGGSGSCDTCHGAPPGSGTDTGVAAQYAQSHSKHYNFAAGGSPTAPPGESAYPLTGVRSATDAYVFDCGWCHSVNLSDHRSNNDGTVDVNLNVPGYSGTFVRGSAETDHQRLSVTFKDFDSTCSNIYCHGNFTGGSNATVVWGSSGTALCGTCHGSSAGTPPSGGSHSRHVAGANMPALDCDMCHNGVAVWNSVQDKTKHANIVINWNLKTSDNRIGSGGAIYNGAGSGWKTSVGSGYGSCGNVYCHSSIQGSVGAGSPASYGWPTWGGTVDCTTASCHGGDADPGKMATGAHTKHVQTAGYSYACSQCHNGAGHNTTKHADYSIDVALTGGGSYSQTTNTPGNGYGSCSSTYCHSNGTSASGTHAAMSWGTTVNSTCSSCHGGDATAGNVLATNAHGAHINNADAIGFNVGCAVCHSQTASGNRSISTFAYHVNGNVNVRFDNGTLVKDSDAPAYNGNPATSTTTGGSSKAAGTATGSCENVYCHSVGNINNAGTPVTPTFLGVAWNTGGFSCGSCHGDAATKKAHPVYASGAPSSSTANSHVKHVESSALSCDYCHLSTVDTAWTTFGVSTAVKPWSSGGTHLDRTVNISFKANAGKTGNYSSSTKTCSATYCHGTNASAPWGTTANCADCHDATGAGLSLRHDVHYNSATKPTTLAGGVNAHTSSAYVYACLQCHPTNSHARGPWNSSADAEVGGAKITWYSIGSSNTTDSRGYKYSLTGNCGTVCHTRDGITGSPIVAPNWGSSATGACGGCHNKAGDPSPVWSAPHTKHLNTYSGNSNITCESCHSGTAASNAALKSTSAARDQHPNANKDVAIGSFAGGAWVTVAGAQGSQTCANTYCHSNGSSTTGSHAAIGWSGSFTACNECHGNAASLATGAHGQHLAVSGVTCSYCHNATASGNTSISSFSYHVDKNVEINFNAAAAGGSATYNGNTAGGATVYQKPIGSAAGACASTTCHGSGNTTPTWTSVTTYNMCTKCHGTKTVTVTVSNRYVVAPPADAAGDWGTATGTGQVSNDTKVGAHQTHLRYLNGLRSTSIDTNDDRCGYCHGALPGSIAHADGSSTPNGSWSTLATHNGAMSPNYSGVTCSNTYCHNPAGSGGTMDAGNTGTDTSPDWTDSAYIADGTLKTQTNCGKCHKSPGDAWFTSTYSHSVAIGDDCSGCHGHNGETSGSVGQRHMDGVKYGAGSCSSCHDYDVRPDGNWGTNLKAVEGWGAHAKHIAHIKEWNSTASTPTTLNPTSDAFGGTTFKLVCGVCHTNDPANHAPSGSPNVRTINFGDGSWASMLRFGGNWATYKGVTGTSSSVNPKTCSNLSCHYSPTPVWSPY